MFWTQCYYFSSLFVEEQNSSFWVTLLLICIEFRGCYFTRIAQIILYFAMSWTDKQLFFRWFNFLTLKLGMNIKISKIPLVQIFIEFHSVYLLKSLFVRFILSSGQFLYNSTYLCLKHKYPLDSIYSKLPILLPSWFMLINEFWL